MLRRKIEEYGERLHASVFYVSISPSHRNTSYCHRQPRRFLVPTQLSTKLAALAVALMMNSLLIGGVAYLFSGPLHHHTVVSLAHTARSNLHGAV
jgi:hypothetical protein